MTHSLTQSQIRICIRTPAFSRIFTALLMGTFLSAGCSTSGKKQAQQREQKKAAHPVPKAMPYPVARPAPGITSDELAQWAIRMGAPETPFTIQDRQKVGSMTASPKPGSLAEAALVIGILRDILTPPGGNAKFKEVDLAAAGQPNTDDKSVLPKPMRVIDSASVIETRVREKGIDLSNALANNIFLKNVSVFAWAYEAIGLDGNSDIFKQNVTTVIKSEAMLWQELARKSGATTVVATPAAVAGAPTPTPEPSAPTPSPAVENSAAGQPLPTPAPPSGPAVDAEKQMVMAQDAAAKDNYGKAVEEASKIPSTAPNFAVAQDSIKTWSNRAVTDLRKKAAYEYRAASSVTDVGIKRSYLSKAKAYLEEAAQKFPASSTQDTVKENLGMITKELERLN